MKSLALIVTFCALVMPASVLAQQSQTKPAVVRESPKVQAPQRPETFSPAPFGILRQDLFDRTNPNNRASDYPAPTAQPGQF